MFLLELVGELVIGFVLDVLATVVLDPEGRVQEWKARRGSAASPIDM